MKRAFDTVIRQLQAGEELIAAGVEELSRRWHASATLIGELCAETDRWQSALRKMHAPGNKTQTPIDLAEILRARTAPRTVPDIAPDIAPEMAPGIAPVVLPLA
jgi:hypothetical protein